MVWFRAEGRWPLRLALFAAHHAQSPTDQGS